MVHLLLICGLLIPTQLYANDVYQYKDQYGRTIFSDTPNIGGADKIIRIEIQNEYDWHNPELKLKKSRGTKYKRKRRKKEKTYSLSQLQNKCTQARYRYQNYRGTNNSNDWGSYKSKVKNYADKRDYWCSRALKRK